MGALTTPGKIARRQTMPYLGIACLALLAFTGLYAAAPEVAALGEAPALGLPALTWLTDRAARPTTSSRLAVRSAGHTLPGWSSARPAAPSSHRAAFRAQPVARTRGALSLPALLIAVTLAQIH